MKNSLICPFLNEENSFAYGVEFGMLYSRMSGGSENAIEDFFCRENQDQILLLANRLGWHVEQIKNFDKDWFWLSMTKAEPELYEN